LTQEANFASQQVQKRALSDTNLSARARLQWAVKKVTEQRLRKLRNGVRIKLNSSKSLDDSDYDD